MTTRISSICLNNNNNNNNNNIYLKSNIHSMIRYKFSGDGLSTKLNSIKDLDPDKKYFHVN